MIQLRCGEGKACDRAAGTGHALRSASWSVTCMRVIGHRLSQSLMERGCWVSIASSGVQSGSDKIGKRRAGELASETDCALAALLQLPKDYRLQITLGSGGSEHGRRNGNRRGGCHKGQMENWDRSGTVRAPGVSGWSV
jgi:hypothetical protein